MINFNTSRSLFAAVLEAKLRAYFPVSMHAHFDVSRMKGD